MALTSDDLAAINQLYAAYCHAIDDRDGKAFSSCFVPDGSLEVGGQATAGHEALTRFAEELAPGLRHVVSNVHIEGDGAEAHGRAHVLVYTQVEGSPSLMVSGRYRDSLRRVGDAWLFDERHFTPDS
jgi:uncharacterized protein (TIGR02246 family)